MSRNFACDPVKRAEILDSRGFDLLAMAVVFGDSRRSDDVDTRFDYGEERRITIEMAFGRTFTVVSGLFNALY